MEALQDPKTRTQIGSILSVEWNRDNPDEGALGAAIGGVAAVGKGVVEAPLKLARGAQWLMNKIPGLDFSEPIETDLRNLLPEDYAQRLESRLSQGPMRGALEGVGGFLGIPAGGGAGLISKTLGIPGKAVKAFGAPVVKLGEKLLEKVPALSRLGKVSQMLPQTIGSGTGFGLYEFMSAEGGWDQRMAAAQHGLVAGAAMHVLGEVAAVAEKGILSFGTSLAEKKAAKALLDGIRAGKPEPGLLWKVGGRAVSSAIEGTGFAGLDPQFWKDAIAGANGDEEAMTRAMQTWSVSMAAVLIGKTGHADAFRMFRRDIPELNTLATRLELEAVREPPKEPTGPQEPAGAPQATVQAQKPLGAPQDPQKPQGDSIDTAYRLPALQKASDPLFKSGWDMKPGVETDGGRQIITMEFPGAGEIRMWENEQQAGPAGEAFGLEVPASVFRTVRGDVPVPEGTENIRMVGKVAEEFSRDLAAVSMLRRIRGEVLFGGEGEVWAGGPWRGQQGEWHTIGLDGQHYTMSVPDGETTFSKDVEPTMPVVQNDFGQDPQMQRWAELAQALREHTAPNPGLDLLEASIALVLNGDPRSISLQETAAFLTQPWQEGVTNADIAAAMLRPDTIEQFGMTLGQVAAGHLNADAARQQIGTMLLGSAKGKELQAPPQEGSEPDQGSIAGERDWFTADPTERRDAARAYAQQNPEANAPMLRDTFGIPRETARDILGEKPSSDGGFISTQPIADLGNIAVEAGKAVVAGYEKGIKPQLAVLAERGGEPGRQLANEFREQVSRKRALLGASGVHATEAIKAAKRIPGHLVGVTETGRTASGEEYPTLRYRNLIEGVSKPADSNEESIYRGGRGALLTMQHTASGAGAMYSGADGYRKSSPMSEARVPWQYSRDPKSGYFKMLENAAARKAFYRELERLNPDVSAVALEKAYKDRKGGTKVEDSEVEAAFEIQRQMQHVPATFKHGGKTWEVLEPDMAVALHDIMQRQSGRVATIQVQGQDLPEAVRKEYGIEKPGITDRLARFAKELADTNAEGQDALVQMARDLAERIQGREPKPLGKHGQLISDILSIPRAIGAWTAGIYDIPNFVTEPAVYVGVKNMVRALFDIMKERGFLDDPRKFGSLAHEIGNLDMAASQSVLRKFADVIQIPSNWTEEWKTAFFDRCAKVWLRSMEEHPCAGDRAVLVDLLRLEPAQAEQVMNGSAPQALKDQVRRELVVRMTNRGRMEERSEWAANPTVRLWVRYTGYATMRIDELATEVASAVKTMADPKSTIKERAAAAKRAIYRAGGIGFGGAVSMLLYYLVQDLFRGQNGAERFKRDMIAYPLQTLGRGASGQILSGPFGSTATAIASGDPAQLAFPIEGANAVAGIMKAWASGSGDPFVGMLVNSGLLPRQARDAFVAAQALYTGSKAFVDLGRQISQWKQLEGVEPSFGPANKPQEFYNAMRRLREMVGKHAGDIAEVTPEIMGEIEAALGLDTGESVAGKLRSMRYLPQLSEKERDSLLRYLGPDKFEHVVHIDDTLTALAREAGKKAGTYPMEWAESVDLARGQAQAGAANAWGKLIDRAVDDNARAFLAKTPPSIDMDELAMAIADYPEALAKESHYSDDYREAFKRMSHPRLRSTISGLMRQSFATRTKMLAKRDAEDAAKNPR